MGKFDDYAKYLRPGDTKEEIANLLVPATPDPSVRSYEPTWRDRLALALGLGLPEQTVEGLTGSRGIGATGVGLVDLTPLGIPFTAQEARQAALAGDVGGAALGLAGLVPVPGAKAGAKAAKAVIGHNSGKVAKALKTAKAAEDFGPNELPLPARANYSEGLKTFEPLPGSPEGALPAYLSPDARAVIEARGEQMALKPRQRVQPDPNALGLDLSEENYRRTYSDVPQTSLEGEIPYPTEEQAAKMPLGARAAPLLDTSEGGLVDRIATKMADDVRASGHMGADTQHFYGLYPLKEFLVSKGVPPDEAQRQIETFGKYYAATSPRTNTENNLRHASLLSAIEAANPGIDLTDFLRGGLPKVKPPEKQKGFLPTGFNQMMAMHTDLANTLRGGGDINLKTNTKPSLFARSSAGNVADPVADTHNIRSIMFVWNQLHPGEVNPAWLKKDARARYAADPTSFNPATDVEDTLTGHTVKGQYAQTEYGPIANVTRAVADKLGMSPGEAQALMWFTYGEHTGLDSAPKSIAQLIQERASVTGKLIGMDPHEVILKVFRREIPLAALFGGAVGAGMAGGNAPPGGDYAAGLKPDQRPKVF